MILWTDPVYITVSDMAPSEAFYDRVMEVLGFRKSAMTNFASGRESYSAYFSN